MTPSPASPAGIWDGPSVSQAAADVFTSFEFDARGGFVNGTTPYRATYSSGDAQTVGNTSLYHAGLFAWHILNGTVATVTFETLPNTLSFWVRTANTTGVSNIDILDDNGVVIRNVMPTNAYQMISIVRGAGQTLIDLVEVTSISGGDVVIDDLTFGYSGSGFVGGTDNIGCVVAEMMEVVCVITDPITGAVLVSAEATLQIANVTRGLRHRHAIRRTWIDARRRKYCRPAYDHGGHDQRRKHPRSYGRCRGIDERRFDGV